MTPLKYKNITISGGAASGKGTLSTGLRPYLEPLGWTFRSSGELIRNYTKEYKVPFASLANDEFHKKVEQLTIDFLDKGNVVIESWLAGYMAKDRSDTLRVFIYCSSDEARIERVMRRDNVDREKAKTIIFDRQTDNFREWKRIYGDHDFWDPSYYHIAIDSANTKKNEMVFVILEAIGMSDYDRRI